MGDPKKKQMKVFLSPQEHAIVIAAAAMKSMKTGQYMKMTILDQAKKDAKGISKLWE
jgi:transcriptional regulator of nitric oxide reductase